MKKDRKRIGKGYKGRVYEKERKRIRKERKNIRKIIGTGKEKDSKRIRKG